MTSILQARDGASVDLSKFFKAVQTRLTTADVTRVLGGGKVYRGTEDYGAPERTDNKPWGRLVIIPGTFLWPVSLADGSRRPFNFVVRSEMNDFSAPGYDVALDLGVLQQQVWAQLNGWLPGPAEAGAVLTQAVYCQRPAQAVPEWDEDRSLWWTSSEWRCEATRIQ